MPHDSLPNRTEAPAISIPAISIKVLQLHPAAKLPVYAFSGPFGDLAADLYAVEDLQLVEGFATTVPTGLAFGLPPGFGAIVEGRSGLAIQGVGVLGGVIDPGYRGEVKVILTYSKVPSLTFFGQIKAGDRIAQLRIVRRLEATFEWSTELDSTGRGDGGFGSTGRGPSLKPMPGFPGFQAG